MTTQIVILTFLLFASVSAFQQGGEVVPGVQSVQSPNVHQAGVVQPSLVHAGAGVPVDAPVSVVDHNAVNGGGYVHSHHGSMPSFYAPAGVIQVVGNDQVVPPSNKPQVAMRNFEQYGQPESASLPPNYKPFGSWGLYIGGNPADGYYTNYYNKLSNSVDKQQGDLKPSGVTSGVVGVPSAGPSASAALSPVLRQASSSPYVGGDYYPFAYSTSELNTGTPTGPAGVVPSHSGVGGVHSPVVSPYVSPVHAGASVYGTPTSFESSSLSYAADSYASGSVGGVTKKQGTLSYAGKDSGLPKEQPFYQQLQQQQQQQQAKGSTKYAYAYSPFAAAAPPAPASTGQPQQQVVAYPVPVGSQMVGSQPGVDGAFQPYGIHAFTRYAVKPTVVNSDQSYYYQFPSYKHMGSTSSLSSVQASPQTQPLGFYGYPLSQLHYSQGSIVPAVSGHSSVSSPSTSSVGSSTGTGSVSANSSPDSPVASSVHQAQPVVESAVAPEKSESDEKVQVKPTQSRA